MIILILVKKANFSASIEKNLVFEKTRVGVLIKLIASLVQERNTTRTDLLYVFRTTYQVKR